MGKLTSFTDWLTYKRIFSLLVFLRYEIHMKRNGISTEESRKKGPVFSEEIDNLERGGIAERNVKDNKWSCIRENKSW